MADAGAQVVFELYHGALSATALDVLGLWETSLSTSASGIAFAAAASATATRNTDVPIWRANLSADLGLAAAQLASGEARLSGSRNALDSAAGRLQAFTEAQGLSLAFAVDPARTPLPRPEAALLVWLQGLEAGEPPVSFGLGDEVASEWKRATRQFQASIERLLQLVVHNACVETHVQECLVARTAVGWTGDLQTVWYEPVSAAHAALHQRALALALASRDTLLRTFALAVRGALTLSILLATPGGAVLALPAAWRFINQVLAELGEQPETTQEPSICR